jgi:DNA-binding response OmpR family regulator
MPSLLIGETHTDLSDAMHEYFSGRHYSVQVESNGLRVLEHLTAKTYDVVILDITLPSLDGISIVRDYRANRGTAPIVIVSEQHCADELQVGLDAGADAYMVKPFKLDELGAQVRALMRRPALKCERVLRSGDIELDSSEGTVSKDNEQIHLHPMEYRLLHFLLKHPNQVFSTHTIFERVWQKDSGRLEDTVRTHVRTLRQKIDSSGHPSHISTVRGLGYKAARQ